MLLHALAGDRRRQHSAVFGGVVVGIATLLVCCRVFHSLRRARQSCLQHNAQQHVKHCWCRARVSLVKLLPRAYRPAHSDAGRLSCSWARVLHRDMLWPVLSSLGRSWRRNPIKLLLCLLLAALLGRELISYLHHLQHAGTDTPCPRHARRLDSLTRTARCTFSAHRQDLCHLLQVLKEEAVTFWEEMADNVRYGRELARVINLLETWSVRYTKMLVAKAFVQGYEAGHGRGLRAGRAAGLLAREQGSSLKMYVWGWQEGYEHGYKRGFRRGKREGFDKGYNDGYDKGKAEGKARGGARR